MTDTEAKAFVPQVRVPAAGREETVSRVAQSIVSQLRPQTALDLGSGADLLVGQLRSRGVDATGVDISGWTVAEDLDGDFDVITCIEVLQHLSGHDGQAAIAAMCRHGRAILFSSSPDEFDDPANVNVQPSDYWVSLFADQGFFRNLEYDATYVSPHAVLLEPRAWTAADVARAYERAWWQAHHAALGARATHDRLTEMAGAAAAEVERLSSEILDVAGRLDSVSADRDRLSSLLVVEQAIFASQLATAADAGRELEELRRTKTIRYSAVLRRTYGRARSVWQRLLRSR